MLNLKFPVTIKFHVTMTATGHLKIAKNHYFALIFPSKLTEVLQILNGLR
jgi:hypothetical protein